MITKLLKHEYLRTRNPILITYGIGILLCLAAALFGAWDIPILSGLFTTFAVATVVLIVPVTQLMLALDHYHSSFGREAYLTHSLPIRGGTIYTAKLVWAVIVTVVTTALAIGLAALVWPVVVDGQSEMPATLWEGAQALWTALTAALPTWVLLLMVAGAVCMLLSIPVMLYFAIARGSESRLRQLGIGGIAVAFVALYVVQQIVYTLAIFGVPWGIVAGGPDGREAEVVPMNFWTALWSNTSPDAFPLGILPVTLVMVVVVVWLTHRSWEKKISLT